MFAVAAATRLRHPLALGRALSAAPSKTALIKELRARTSAPMKKCVEALASSGNDIDEAVALLRKSGLAAAQKKASRGADEGAIAVARAPSALALVELNSETDFVARNEIFQQLAADVARTALGHQPAAEAAVHAVDPAELSASTLVSDDAGASSVEEALGVAVGQLGENLVLRRACVLRAACAETGEVASYVHNAYAPAVGRTAAAVALRGGSADGGAREALRALGQRLAMHVVAASPLYLDKQSVPAEAIARERDILEQQARDSGKPESVVEKMVEGRLRKFYAEVCLLEQDYVVDDGAGSVAKVLRAAASELGGPVELDGFVRFHVGDSAAAAE